MSAEQQRCPGCGRDVRPGDGGRAPGRPSGSELCPPDIAVGAIDEVMARFIVWLARQDVAPDRRRRYHTHVERYLRWHATSPGTDCSQWRYYTVLRGAGVSDDEVRVARAALSMLACHLMAAKHAAPLPG